MTRKADSTPTKARRLMREPEQLRFDDYASELLDQLCDEWPPVLSARLPLDLQLHKPVRTIRVKEPIL